MYAGEIDQTGNGYGKGVAFKECELAYCISEGFWLDGKLTGLGRTFTYKKES
jgi:hypothetical protein